MQVKDLTKILENIIGYETKEEDWDNCGLILGRCDKQVNKILLAVDGTNTVINQAIEENADIIVTHHPLVFKGRKRITDVDVEGAKLVKLLQNDISIYAMHTNFDKAHMGMAAVEAIGKMTALKNIVIGSLEEFGATFELDCCDKNECSAKDVAELVKNAFDLQSVRVYGDLTMKAGLIKICPGSGKSFADEINANEIYITGDMDHHVCQDITERGGVVIDAGHFAIEQVFSNYMKMQLELALVENAINDVEIIVAKEENPFVTV